MTWFLVTGMCVCLLRETDYLVEFHEQMMLVRLKQNDDKKLMWIVEEKLQPYLENKDIE